MAEVKLNITEPTIADMRKNIQEFVEVDSQSLDNPALERCTEIPISPDKLAKQAYDRMYHTHNRS